MSRERRQEPDVALAGWRRGALDGLSLLERLLDEHLPRNPTEARELQLARAQVGLIRGLMASGTLLGPEGREVMDAKQAAEFMGMGEGAFRSLSPSLPRVRIHESGRYRYLRSDLLAWLEERREGPPGAASPPPELKRGRGGKRGPRKRVNKLV
jgi:hypothetical protein